MARLRWKRGGVAGLVAVSLVALVRAQQPAGSSAAAPAQAAQPPVFRAGINFVRVDVLVSDRRGQPVADLTPADFEVTEDGKPQTIATFRLIKVDGRPAPDAPLAPIRTDEDEQVAASRNDTRLFGIFLDDYHVRRANSVAVREPLSRFIENQLGPADMIGAMYPLEPLSTVRMTRDHDAVVRALTDFVGRKYDYTPRNRLEEQYADYPAETIEQIRNQVSLTALKGLIIHMGTLKEGRKALIVVSEGYSNSLPPQLRDPVASAPGFENPNRADPFAGLNDPVETARTFVSDQDLQFFVRDVWDTANKYNVSLYPIDPRGLPTSEFDSAQPTVAAETDRAFLDKTQDTLREFADRTDGRAIINRNDLAAGMAQIVKDSSAYYLLGYNSTQAPTDGKFHEIKVRVKRSGVEVRARKGYWALTTDEAKKAVTPVVGPPKPVQDAIASIAVATESHSTIRTWIGTERGESGKTKVTFVWEPQPPVPGDARGGAEGAPARVMLTAIAPDGSPCFRGPVPDTRRASFDVPPGRIELRLSVQDASSAVIDSDRRELTVPDLTGAHVVLGTPEVLRARTVRELRQIEADPAAVPVAAREFRRTDRLLVRVPSYGPAGTTPMLTVRLLNRGGQAMTTLQATPASSPDTQQIDLPLAGLAPGDYILEVKAAGDDAAGQLVGFRVTG